MNTMKSIQKGLRHTVFVILLMGFVWLSLPFYSAQAAYSPGAPANPRDRQSTVYEGRVDRNLVSGGNQARAENDSVVERVDETLNQSDSDRPKTTGEWNKEARETKGAPGERLKRIAKESEEAVKDFGSVYPDTAERSARALPDNQALSK